MNISRLLTLFLFVICIPFTITSQELTAKQEAWLYRIVQKTPVLNNSWQEYFIFDTTPFQIVRQGELITNYDAVCYYQQYTPESLQIDYETIKTSSQGLIAEAAIKLTLWELNEELKECIYRPNSCNDTLAAQFKKSLTAILPKIKSKKQDEAIRTVMHPSLPVFKKIEKLDKLKLDASTQKDLLNKWSSLVADHCQHRSQYFFAILSDGASIENTAFLAAGEGSGTAGLLYEKEINPADSSQLWYGKGIGLFTYQLRTYQSTVRLKEHLSTNIQLPANRRVALHTSLWGLNSSFIPMLIITDDTVSYHLFADYDSKSLSVDAHLGEGISHLDRIEQYRKKNITEPLKELQADNSLNSIFNKELDSKAAIEEEIHQLESEIDTLRKHEPDNVNAINYRMRQIDSKLNILSDKERRIKELNEKLRKENRGIIKAEEQLDEMIKLCGPHPQNWQQQGTNYTFPTGVSFDSQTQDLLFPAQQNERTLQISLLSASYTLGGKQKDEVQAYVSLTNVTTQPTIAEQSFGQIDTSFTYFFHPDEYHSYNTPVLDSTLIKHLKQYASIAIHFKASDTHKSEHTRQYRYQNIKREYEQPMTADALKRRATVQLKGIQDTLQITISASTDAVASRLSQSPNYLKQELSVSKTSTTNNSYLEAMRALQTLQTFLNDSQLSNRINRASINFEHPLLTPEECRIIQTTVFNNSSLDF